MSQFLSSNRIESHENEREILDIKRERFETSTRSKSVLDGFRANTKDQLDNLKH